MALTHVVAMVVGCITVPKIIGDAAGLDFSQQVIMMQALLVGAAAAIFLQSFSLNGLLGSNLPIIVGAGFAFIPTMLSIAKNPGLGIEYIFGAQLLGAAAAILAGYGFRYIKFLFAPVVTAAVVTTIGITLYKTALGYIAGGEGSADFGSMQNWAVAIFTLIATLIFANWGKGVFKTASTLFGLITGYILAVILNMVDFSVLASTDWIHIPRPLHFGMAFDVGAIVPMVILFVINAVQDMGNIEATTGGVCNRMATDQEIAGGITANSIGSMIGSVLGGFPNAVAGQNVGLVVTSKVVAKKVFYISSGIVLLTALVPKFCAVFMTIPAPVLGGATVGIFGSIAMTGVRMLANAGMTGRNVSIAGLSIALAIGMTYHPNIFAGFPEWFRNIFGSSAIVIVAIVAIILNLVLPQDKTK